MTSLLPKGKMGTILIAAVLVIALLIGTFLFGYVGLKLLVGGSSNQGRVAQGPTGAPSNTPPPTVIQTPTPTRTAVVIVAATAVPFTPGPMPTATPEGTPAPEATPTVRSGKSPTPTVRPTKAGAGQGTDGKLPQTGLGLGTPLIGAVLAGMAGAARWLRQRF
ncbi:MAG: hypothetical protein QME94_19425, partial [Anaerolineae bacterium]|nr:hypothetical protein [Anaerolineae bacterium]